MASKPTYEELEQRVTELEAEVQRLRGQRDNISRREARLQEAEQLALLGHWELDLVQNTLFWSDEIYRIFDRSPAEFGATYEAFLETVHPDDRELVNEAYSASVRDRTGYDIVHRLLLRDGRVKYVNERCKTEYDEQSGEPTRSLGTVQDITRRVRESSGFAGIVGRDPKMLEVYDIIRELAEVKVPVLIQGESGTGKELVAAAIHNCGPRGGKRFVPVNCAALPEGLLESELFGHVKGSFTGALRDKKGRFELAHDGSLFLDEVADLTRPMQAKLLRVLQEGTFERVGDEKTMKTNARIISAANRDLKTQVDRGQFRDDLFYRLKVVPIHLPSLRERKNDIPLLVEHFLERSAQEGLHNKGISREAVAVLVAYSWPGNVRELHSAVNYALIRSHGEMILPQHLPAELRSMEPDAAAPAPLLVPVVGVQPQTARKSKLDTAKVQRALEQCGGNKVKAAKLLGVGRATLYRFLKD